MFLPLKDVLKSLEHLLEAQTIALGGPEAVNGQAEHQMEVCCGPHLASGPGLGDSVLGGQTGSSPTKKWSGPSYGLTVAGHSGLGVGKITSKHAVIQEGEAFVTGIQKCHKGLHHPGQDLIV